MKKILYSAYAVFSAVILTTGCAGNINSMISGDNVTKTVNEDTNDKSFVSENVNTKSPNLEAIGIEIPKGSPKVIIDKTGYSRTKEKKVLFISEKHGETFNVIRAEDGKVVYTDRVQPLIYDNQSKMSLYYGDFSKIKENGTYYIETDFIGRSYNFLISDTTYENTFIDLIKNMSVSEMELNAENAKKVCFFMDITINALTYNGSLFELADEYIEDEEKEIVPQLLKIAHWLMEQQSSDGSLYSDYETTAAFLGIMSTSRERFGKYDKEFARNCQKSQDLAYKWLKTQKTEKDEYRTVDFFVAGKLMQTSYNEEYQKKADSFLDNGYEGIFDSDSPDFYFAFGGAIAYLDSTHNNNREKCNKLMQTLVDKAEKISSMSKADTMFGTGTRSANECFYNVLLVSFVNYLTPNKEYTVIVENNIIYICGFNELGISYLDYKEIWSNNENTENKNPQWYGIALFGLSDLLYNINNSTQN